MFFIKFSIIFKYNLFFFYLTLFIHTQILNKEYFSSKNFIYILKTGERGRQKERVGRIYFRIILNKPNAALQDIIQAGMEIEFLIPVGKLSKFSRGCKLMSSVKMTAAEFR